MMSLLATTAFVASALLYLIVSVRIHSRASRLNDQFPLTRKGGQAHVLSSNEFSAATVATTISLATVILAFAELAGSLGLWLLWPVITTAAGIFVVRMLAPIIFDKISEFGSHRPTLHEFLGRSYDSRGLMRTAAICTSIGFLGAFAVELTVGAAFLAQLVPILPSWVAVILLAGVGAAYTALGGFRAVIVTDRIQMWAIWLAIFALAALMLMQIESRGGLQAVARGVPRGLYDFSWREGLAAFLVGIFVINVPTFVADMSIWQRIAGSAEREVASSGLWKSAFVAAASWTALALLACGLVILVAPIPEQNPLLTFLVGIGNAGSITVGAAFVFVVAGLYAASLSTASTQLIAASQTIHTDLLREGRDRETLVHATQELALSRKILFGAAVVSVLIVEGLSMIGFSIADLVFAVYGAQLGLVPAVFIALFANAATRRALRPWASAGIALGFAAGWGSAVVGKSANIGDLVFLAPVVSLVLSSVVFGLGWLASSGKKARRG